MRLPVAILAACVALSACTTPIGNSPRKQELNEELQKWMAEQNSPRDSRVRITDFPTPGKRVELKEHQWLRDKKITLQFARDGGPVTANAIAQSLRAKGINIMSSLPLEGYTYTGYDVVGVDGETALRMLFGPMGLDYDVNDDGQYVAILPNRARTFYLKLGERTTTYKSGTLAGNVGSPGSTTSSSSSGGLNGGLGTPGSGGSGGGTTTSGGVSTGLDTGVGKVDIEGDFWKNLKTELDSMLQQCVPAAASIPVVTTSAELPPLPAEISGVPTAPRPMSMPVNIAPATGATPTNTAVCTKQSVGTVSTNPSTGAVTVQAPHWVIEPIAKYLDGVKKDNNVTLTYEGILISVRSTKSHSEGIDLQAFASFASGKLGLVVSNNALGGVTVSGGANVAPTVTTGGTALANTLFGVQKFGNNPAQAFLAYLEANGEYSIKLRPRVSVTNGVPGEWAQYDNLYYTQYAQNSSSSLSGGSAVGTTNQLVTFKVGSTLRIVPYYDAQSGETRSPITFSQSVKTGSFTNIQIVTSANGTTQQIPSEVPIIRDSNYSGEVLMKDGDMIILGGQVSESSSASGSGIPGYNASGNWLSGLMGNKTASDETSTYYLALTLKVVKP